MPLGQFGQFAFPDFEQPGQPIGRGRQQGQARRPPAGGHFEKLFGGRDRVSAAEGTAPGQRDSGCAQQFGQRLPLLDPADPPLLGVR